RAPAAGRPHPRDAAVAQSDPRTDRAGGAIHRVMVPDWFQRTSALRKLGPTLRFSSRKCHHVALSRLRVTNTDCAVARRTSERGGVGWMGRGDRAAGGATRRLTMAPRWTSVMLPDLPEALRCT